MDDLLIPILTFTPLIAGFLLLSVVSFMWPAFRKALLNRRKKLDQYAETMKQGNAQQTKILAMRLAFTVACANKKISVCEIEVIENWAKNNIEANKIFSKAWLKLNKLLGRILVFSQNWNRLYSYRICKKIQNTVPLKVRCDILELCLCVAGANGDVSDEQLAFLKDISNRIEICKERFRSMTEKKLCLCMHKIEDTEISLGVTSDMSKDQICEQLSKEYRKWNSRVTNKNSEIKAQAEHMLELIAKLRNEHLTPQHIT